VPARLVARILRAPDAIFAVVAPRIIKVDPEARSSMWDDLSRGRKTEIDALNGRTSSDGAAVAEARTVPDRAVVVELGTNDQSVAAFEANAERILASFRGAPLVLWQNVEGPPDLVPADEINAAIESLAGRRPNVAIADWDGSVPEEYLFDGVHPDPAHADAMAALIAPMLQRWWSATTEPPACS